MATATLARVEDSPSNGRTRSFGGCTTCRMRHMKCDETHPTCSMCAYAGLMCGGYEKTIFFDFKEASELGTTRFRRPLFSETERECMSQCLVSSVPPRLTGWSISLIDEECEAAPASQDLQICRGPFGAFRLSEKEATRPIEIPSDEPDDSNSQLDDFRIDEDDLPSPEGVLALQTQQLFQSMLDLPEQNSPSQMLTFEDLTSHSGRIHEIFDDVSISHIEQTPTTQINVPPLRGFQCPPPIFDTLYSQSIESDHGSIAPTIGETVPHDAVFLLKHYSTTVLKALTPFRHGKTPWHILFIPHVKNCLAALTLGEEMDHASLCVFYGTLAISAFSLVGVSQSHMWLEKGELYKQRAREQVRLTLKTAYDVPKTAKYKSILMALLTMVHMSIASGNQEQTECYFLETERFIRVKGLNRRKSRKVRLLHHCYAYERMFYESTFIGGTNSSHRHHVRRAIESSGAAAYSKDSLSFRLSHWDNLAQEMQRIKGCEESENDLHLQLPGFWSRTLYPEIFGLPEPYLLILSLIIRLASEKENAEQDEPHTLGFKDFTNHARSLERCIKQVKLLSADTYAKLHQQMPRVVLDSLLDAMQNSLAIYFYRRIYDLDASLLQQKVVIVRDCLLRLESADPSNAYGTVRLIWPAFIAACEAEEPEVQALFSSWFQDSAQRSGLRMFTDTMARIERIWEEKRCADGGNIKWLDLMRRNI